MLGYMIGVLSYDSIWIINRIKHDQGCWNCIDTSLVCCLLKQKIFKACKLEANIEEIIMHRYVSVSVKPKAYKS